MSSKRALLRLIEEKPGDHVSLVDHIDDQILFAQGIKCAVMGEASICAFDSSHLSALFDVHIEKLEAIRERASDLVSRAKGVQS
jgi:hypothetical protein